MIRFLFTLTILLLPLTTSAANANPLENTGLQMSKIHLSFGSGVSFSTIEDYMSSNFYSSSLFGTVEFMGYSQKYPISSRDIWNFNGEISYRVNNEWQPGFGVYLIPTTRIKGFGDASILSVGPYEESEGIVYYLVMDYLFDPMKNLDYSRWEFSAGAGLSYASFNVRGDMGSIYIAPTSYTSDEWEISKYKIGGVLRATLDYYLQEKTSLRLRFGANILPNIDVPEQWFQSRRLHHHRINFSTYDVTLSLALHL